MGDRWTERQRRKPQGTRGVASSWTICVNALPSRSLMPGARVPSIRVMTDALGVSKSTVVEAYDRLVAEGVIVARRGSGFFVSGHAPPLALPLISAASRSRGRSAVAHAPVVAIRTQGAQAGCGWMPASSAAEDGGAPRVASDSARSAVAGSPITRIRTVCPRCVSNSRGGSRRRSVEAPPRADRC